MAGILDGYFPSQMYPGAGGGILSRLPEWMLPQAAPSQGFPGDTSGYAGLDPSWLALLKGGMPPQAGGAPQQPGGGSPPPAQAPIFPPGMGTMGGAAGYGAGMDAPQQQPNQAQLPPNAMPTASPSPVGMPNAPQPQQPAQESTGFGDRLGAGLQGFAHGGGSLSGSLEALFGGFATGQRQDNQGIMQRALMAKGWTPDMAKAATSDPAIMQQIIPSLFGPKNLKWTQVGEDMMGNKQFGFVDEATGRIVQPGANGGGPPGSSPGVPGQEPSYLAPGTKQVDSSLSGDAYLNQFSPEVKAAVKAYVAGESMPTGNPRKGFTQTIKMIAQKYGQDIGIPADDASFSERRKMRTDIGSSGANSMGGILSNGKSAFEHLANLSDKMTDLTNYNGPNVPGGAHIAEAGNFIGNRLLPTSTTTAKIQAASDNALKYGQEATKFYAGSGGGEAERMFALRGLDFGKSSSNDQAAFLQTEKELMLGRLKQKEDQVRQVLGQDYLDKHPVMTDDLRGTIKKIDDNIGRLHGQGAPTAAAAPQPAAGIDRAALEAEARRRGLIK